jgi:hypothetical protein
VKVHKITTPDERVNTRSRRVDERWSTKGGREHHPWLYTVVVKSKSGFVGMRRTACFMDADIALSTCAAI